MSSLSFVTRGSSQCRHKLLYERLAWGRGLTRQGRDVRITWRFKSSEQPLAANSKTKKNNWKSLQIMGRTWRSLATYIIHRTTGTSHSLQSVIRQSATQLCNQRRRDGVMTALSVRQTRRRAFVAAILQSVQRAYDGLLAPLAPVCSIQLVT